MFAHRHLRQVVVRNRHTVVARLLRVDTIAVALRIAVVAVVAHRIVAPFRAVATHRMVAPVVAHHIVAVHRTTVAEIRVADSSLFND